MFNSTSLCATKKFRNFKGSTFAVRRIADHLCIENGLSIVANPKPSKGKGYGKWMGDTKLPSNREKLERMIDAALQNCKDYAAFIAALIAAGCEVKRGKNLSIKILGAERFARCKSLGTDYTEEAILERLMGLRRVVSRQKIFQPPKISLVIDLQQKLEEGKSTGYLNWAKSFNLKQAAKALIYLQEHNLLDYDLLTKTVTDSSAHYHQLLKSIKADEKRMAEIKELQKYIGQYGKTREVYKQYRNLKSQKDRAAFYDVHVSDILLHQAAKKFFDTTGLKKFPSINTLKQEYATLNAGLGKQYAEYKAAKQKMTDLQITKQNVDWILDGPIYPTKVHQRGVHSR